MEKNIVKKTKMNLKAAPPLIDHNLLPDPPVAYNVHPPLGKTDDFKSASRASVA